MRWALFLLSVIATAQTPPDVMRFLRETAYALASAHTAGAFGGPDATLFLDKFDNSMPDYGAFRDEILELVARAAIGSAIDIVSDTGDDRKRQLELDWYMEVEDQQPRRKVIKCTIERKKKDWKITNLQPIDFFRY